VFVDTKKLKQTSFTPSLHISISVTYDDSYAKWRNEVINLRLNYFLLIFCYFYIISLIFTC